MSLELLWDVLKNSLFITGLVVIMMIMIEYVNVASAGKWLERLRTSGFRQVVLDVVGYRKSKLRRLLPETNPLHVLRKI